MVNPNTFNHTVTAANLFTSTIPLLIGAKATANHIQPGGKEQRSPEWQCYLGIIHNVNPFSCILPRKQRIFHYNEALRLCPVTYHTKLIHEHPRLIHVRIVKNSSKTVSHESEELQTKPLLR